MKVATVAHKTGAVLYRRVSTPGQLDNFSIETQDKACRDLCKRRGYIVLDVFQEAESASTTDRPRFQAMLGYCKKHRREVGAVVVYASSRFARNLQDYQNVREDLRELDIRLLSAIEDFDDSTATSKMFANFLALQSQFDNDQRSERTIAGMVTALNSGKWVHKAPIGYVNSPAPGGMSRDPNRAGLVRKVFELYAEGKQPKTAVLKIVTDLGLRMPKSGRPLSAQCFDKLLCYETHFTADGSLPRGGLWFVAGLNL